jgi:hypothetical protein
MCVQEGAKKMQTFVDIEKKRKSLDRQSKVDALESEVRWLDPVLERFWKQFPQMNCPFVGELPFPAIKFLVLEKVDILAITH